MVSVQWDEGQYFVSVVIKSKYWDFETLNAFQQIHPADGFCSIWQKTLSVSWIMGGKVIVILHDSCWIDLIILAHSCIIERKTFLSVWCWRFFPYLQDIEREKSKLQNNASHSLGVHSVSSTGDEMDEHQTVYSCCIWVK